MLKLRVPLSLNNLRPVWTHEQLLIRSACVMLTVHVDRVLSPKVTGVRAVTLQLPSALPTGMGMPDVRRWMALKGVPVDGAMYVTG